MAVFSRETERVFLLAISETTRLGHPQVKPEHLLLALARARSDVSRELFNIGLPLERLRLRVGQSQTANTNDLPIYSEAARQLVKVARDIVKDKTITPKTMLLAIIQQSQGKAFEILKATGGLERLVVWLLE